MNKRGQVRGTLVGALIGVAIAALITFALLPTIQIFIDDANLTGASAALAVLVPFALVLAIVLAALRTSGVV